MKEHDSANTPPWSETATLNRMSLPIEVAKEVEEAVSAWEAFRATLSEDDPRNHPIDQPNPPGTNRWIRANSAKRSGA
jgi:hypothetical protein